MSTSISISILVLHICSASIMFLYQHINWCATIYLFKHIIATTDQLLAISWVKVEKSKVNYTVLLWGYGNEFEHCQYVLNRFVTNLNCITLDKN